MDNPARLAKETAKVCDELDYELITNEEDWQDWRLVEDGVVKTVSIDLDNNTVTLEIAEGNNDVESYEYSEDMEHTARRIKSKL